MSLIIHPRRRNITVPQPLLHLDDVGLVGQGVGGSGGAQGVDTPPECPTDFLSLVFAPFPKLKNFVADFYPCKNKDLQETKIMAKIGA